MRKKTILGLGLPLLAIAVAAGGLLYRANDAARDRVADDRLKTADAAPPDAAAIQRGAYVAATADCAACHTAPGSAQAFAGGYPLKTPFGVLISSNITPDRETGIGDWTERDFFRAVRHGQSPHGPLYAAMPYNAYVKLTDQDMHDLWAYMRSQAPVHNHIVSNQLPFPFNIRLLNLGWNLLFFDNHPFQPKGEQSAEWNRGAYLVDGPGHCAACHTAKNPLGGDSSAYLQGGPLQGWYAPEIANNPHVGLGAWTVPEIAQYLKTGSNGRAVASGPMAEAVENSTQHLTDADLVAIATYLRTVPGSNTQAPGPLAADDARMRRGAQVYAVNCSACHEGRGQGVADMVTGFAGNPAVQSANPDSLVQTLLKGGRGAVTEANPTGAGMPAFGWKLNDADAAAVLTFIRNSWGNAAAPVTADQVAATRAALGAPAVVK
ncbi:MAG: cytochrome c [Azospirillaceae bacterium]|nr:cytochrome c [Azospirillaceae bacterium]